MTDGETQERAELGLFGEVLLEADRDRIPGSSPVVSFSAEDDAEDLARLFRSSRRSFDLFRRQVDHGSWAEVLPEAVGLDPTAELADLGLLQHRWRTNRPVVLPGILGPVAEDEDLEATALALHTGLERDGGLRRWLESRSAELPAGFRLRGKRLAAPDDERSLEKVGLAWQGRGEPVGDLWCKSTRLSTDPADRSLRLRCSFGAEVEEDASRDLFRHRLVSELAESLLPGAERVHRGADLARALERSTGLLPLFTQHIAYWNAPGGGALFHHDSFYEEPEGRQLGVLYVQLVGRTAWLALSSEDLARRVGEIAEELAGGAMPWLREDLFPRPADFTALLRLVRDPRRLRRELGLPGCGSLARLVGRGPEFTAYLADAGHAALLGPGDAILMPGVEPADTCMHSVFCASEERTYSLSMALRSNDPPPARRRRTRRRGRD